ncbi:MAG: ABC transporter permease [Corallococcus sp.]|nr:ABC transporter permease [Corallococcus sp.]MCM1359575.1 ABC transporter permease [Corallococcus sp.]MCM1395167.1 ABC transporter permease [Corallococcus sp.]
MLKYIVKRILLALLILLGVSLIIYVLVRLMPVNYLENKYSQQIQQKTMSLDDIRETEKKLGLFTPDAYSYVEADFGDGEQTFSKDSLWEDWERVQNGVMNASEFYYGNYYTEDRNWRLELDDENKTFTLYKIVDGTAQPTGVNGDMSVDDQGTYKLTLGIYGEAKVTCRQATGLEKTGAVLGGYFTWLGNMLKGDLGTSFDHNKPVTEVISQYMWVSFFISLVALVLEFVIAIPMGITSATHQYSVRDYTVTVITMLGISLPSFFFAALLIKVFSTAGWLGWFPASGLVSGGSSSTGIAYFGDMLWHLILPMVVLVVLSVGGMMRYTRTNMLEVLNSDYIRTARAKGLSEKKVVYVHAFRNTMIPLMTLIAGILPSLFGGAMITEQVFKIDGIGNIAYKALRQADLPLIMGYNMFLAILTVIGTLLSDIMYAVVDPRVKLTK